MIGGEWIILIVLGFLFIITSSAIAIFLVIKLRWPLRWELYEELVPGTLTRTKRGKCRPVRFGDGGEEILFLNKINRHRASYGKRIDKNTIAWAVGQDGYWYNITLEGVNKRLHQAGIMPADRDMRMASTTIRKGIEHRYNEKTFMEKYGTIIAFGMLFLCILAMGTTVYVVFDKQSKITGANLETMKASKEVIESVNKVLANLDKVKTGGSGIVTA